MKLAGMDFLNLVIYHFATFQTNLTDEYLRNLLRHFDVRPLSAWFPGVDMYRPSWDPYLPIQSDQGYSLGFILTMHGCKKIM